MFVVSILFAVSLVVTSSDANSEEDAPVEHSFFVVPTKTPAVSVEIPTSPTGPKPGNPYLSFLPNGVVGDYELWKTRIEGEAKSRRELRDRQTVQQDGPLAQLIPVAESEGVGVQGVNDTPATAEFIGGLGTGSGDDSEADVSGNLQAAASIRAITQDAEENGSIGTATDSTLVTNDGVITSGEIGDGAWGSAAKVATDINPIAEPNGTRGTAIATGLAPFGAVTANSTIGDGAYGSGGSGEGDFDAYAIPINGTEFVTITVARDANITLRPTVFLLLPDGTVAATFEDTLSPGTVSTTVALTSGALTDWYIYVGGGTGFPTDPDDPLTGPGVATEGDYTIEISYALPGDYDVFEVTAAAGETITVEVDTDTQPFLQQGLLDPIVGLFQANGDWVLDSGGNEVLNDDDPNAIFGVEVLTDSFLSHTFDAAGTYYVFVGGFNNFPTDPNSFPTDRTDPSSGPRFGSEGPYEVTITRVEQDVDYYSFDLDAGDIISANAFGGGEFIGLFNPAGSLLVATPIDTGGAYPASSPLPLGGNASMAYIVNETGTYSMAVLSGSGAYTLEIRAFRPPSEASQVKQRLYLDYSGPSVDTSVYGSAAGTVVMSPLSSFLAGWGLAPSDEDALIDAINAVVEDRLRDHLIETGLNDQFDIEILNSKDHPDPWGEADVSRVVIGGTIAELGISTIGIAESLDVGNFDQSQDSIVLLDLLSDPSPSNPNSLNSFGLDPGSTKIDLVANGVGIITAHEAGHHFANWHTSRISADPNIMDEGGDLQQTLGIGPDGIFGTGDDITVHFGEDVYSSFEVFIGVEDTKNAIAFAMYGADDPLPYVVVSDDVTGDGIEDVVVARDGSTLAEVRSGANGSLQRTLSFFQGFDATPITAAALPDSDGDGNAELAILASRDSDGRPVVEIRNLAGAQAPRLVWFGANQTPVDMAVVESDADGNNIAELAVLSRRDSDGRGIVEVKNAFGATNPSALFAGAGLTSSHVIVVPDKDNNNIDEIAILSTRDSDGRIVAELKNAAGATLPTAVWFLPGNTAIDITTVPDKDNNGIPEVAVLSTRNSDGRNVVEIKNAAGPTAPSAVWFAPGHTATHVATVNDADGNGTPEVAVLSVRDSDGRILTEVKNVTGATNPASLWYPPGHTARNLAIIEDTDGNTIQEALVLLIRDSDGRIRVQGRNAAGAPAPKDYWFLP
ncbi:MAG: DVUA0089 family protein [Pseudomonadota bacterium]